MTIDITMTCTEDGYVMAVNGCIIDTSDNIVDAYRLLAEYTDDCVRDGYSVTIKNC